MSSNKFLPSLGRWLRAGASTALFRSPRWAALGLAYGPGAGVVAALVALVLAQAVLFQRYYVDGPALFYWQAVAYGWLPFALLPFYALLLRGSGPCPRPGAAPNLAMLATLLLCVDAFGMLAGALAWLAAAGLQLAVLLRGWRRDSWLR